MKFAKIVFLIGGIYGLLATVPLYFLEEWLGANYPPAITHPEYFYLFIGVTTAWQLVFLVISRDPVRYRPLMLLGVAEKVAMLVALLVLAPAGRFPASMTLPCAIDLLLGVLFAVAYRKTAP